MTTINDLEPRLRKLIPMLGSDNAGEVANAARMITNILKSEKLDWHEIVKKLFEAPPKTKTDYNTYSQTGKKQYDYSQQQNSYNQYKYSSRSYETDDYEFGNNWFWERKESGNYSGEIFGRHCTVFQSKRVPGTWDAVINEFGGKKIWLHGYKTAKAAKDFVVFKLNPDAKDEW